MHRMSALFGLLCLMLYVNCMESFMVNVGGPSRIRHLNTPSTRNVPPRDVVTRTEAIKKTKSNSSSNDNNSNKVKATTTPPTHIEDGSPLGVAIVVLGSLLWFAIKGESDTNTVGGVPVIGIIFGTASTAAGIARLVRYSNSTRKN